MASLGEKGQPLIQRHRLGRKKVRQPDLHPPPLGSGQNIHTPRSWTQQRRLLSVGRVSEHSPLTHAHTLSLSTHSLTRAAPQGRGTHWPRPRQPLTRRRPTNPLRALSWWAGWREALWPAQAFPANKKLKGKQRVPSTLRFRKFPGKKQRVFGAPFWKSRVSLSLRAGLGQNLTQN